MKLRSRSIAIFAISGVIIYLFLTRSPHQPMFSQTTTPPPPQFKTVATEKIAIATNGDRADVYYPNPPDLNSGDYSFPIALFLQGYNVDKSHYSQFAQQVARYGFVVIVPNHFATIRGGAQLFARVQQIPQSLAHLQAVRERDVTSFSQIIDPHKLVLLGHSHGGAVGLDAIRGACEVPFCVGEYAIPEALVGAVFFGTFLLQDGDWVDNSGIPLALIAGDRDSIVPVRETRQTYEAIADPPKAYIEVMGANHYGITNTDNPPGSPPEPNSPDIPQAIAIETIARWTALFLRSTVLEDAAAIDYITGAGDLVDPHATAEIVL